MLGESSMRSSRGTYLPWRGLLLLFLLANAHCWVIGSKKGGKDAPAERKGKSTLQPKIQTKQLPKLPPTTFVRIFALPSEEAKMAQHRLGELLAAACKNYARNGGCKMSSSSSGHDHIRVLEFQEGTQRSIVAYMLQENDADIEKALDACEAKAEAAGKTTAAIENGKDYRCYMDTAVNMTSRQEVLRQMRKKMESLDVYEHLEKAPHKSIFLTADPRLIVYQECHRLVGDNNDYDFFLQKVRDSYRRVIEWLAWQHQEIKSLVEDTPLLYSHADELDNNEQAEIKRVMDFLQIHGPSHVGEAVMTAKRGEMKFQKDRLRAALATLPGTMLADIEDFLEETLQDKQLVAPYMGNATSSRFSWPPPKLLQDLALDNTILVTAATCAYAPLVINWMKQINELGIPCFVVIALDDEIYNFLHNWQPQHVIRAPPGFTSVVPKQYAAQGSGAMKHLSRVRIATLKAFTEQGYNVAWSDADLAMKRNVFTIMSRWFDFTASWANGSGDPMPIYEKTAGYQLKFPDKERIISPSFLYFRGSEASRDFIGKWAAAANKSASEEDGVLLNRLLRDPEVNMPLNVEMLPESTFPSGQNLFHNTSAGYKKEWEKEPFAWAHPDSAGTLEEKVKLLSSNDHWKVVPEDPIPMCKRPDEDYLEDGSSVALWPPAKQLAEIQQDNTIFLTSSTCAYADLMTNWVKHVHGLSINCFYVAAADQVTAGFLEKWVPSHASQTPAELIPKKVSQFAERGTAPYTSVALSRPLILKKVLAQGYNAAWSDADVAWLRNPFTMFDKASDVVLAWAGGSDVSPGATLKASELAGKYKDRQLSAAFIYLQPKAELLDLMDAWAQKLTSSSYVDETAALNSLLRSKTFGNLTISLLPSAAFPTAAEQKEASSKLKEAWRSEENKPAWLHADSATKHDGKVQTMKQQKQWRLEQDEPQPQCGKLGGRKLGDTVEDFQSVVFQSNLHKAQESSRD